MPEVECGDYPAPCNHDPAHARVDASEPIIVGRTTAAPAIIVLDVDPNGLPTDEVEAWVEAHEGYIIAANVTGDATDTLTITVERD